MFESVDGRPGGSKTPERVRTGIAQGQLFRKDFSSVRVPALVLMNAVDTTDDVLASTGYQPKDDEERAAIDRLAARGLVMIKRWTEKLTRHVPDARVVKLGLVGHYVFFTREEQVLREIRAFVASASARRAPR